VNIADSGGGQKLIEKKHCKPAEGPRKTERENIMAIDEENTHQKAC
jgi:hypothetical protein